MLNIRVLGKNWCADAPDDLWEKTGTSRESQGHMLLLEGGVVADNDKDTLLVLFCHTYHTRPPPRNRDTAKRRKNNNLMAIAACCCTLLSHTHAKPTIIIHTIQTQVVHT